MGKKLAILLFIVAVGSSSSVIMAADKQSLHFRAAAPAEADLGDDDLDTSIKANGLLQIGTQKIDLASVDSADAVTRKVAQAQCKAAFARSGDGVRTRVQHPVDLTICSSGEACCDVLTDTSGIPSLTTFVINTFIDSGPGTAGFILRRLSQDGTEVGQKVEAEKNGPNSSVTHFGAENKNVYKDIGNDPAARALIQVRPGGVIGAITIHIYHTQSGVSPRQAPVAITSANNDPTESQALHNAIETALENISPALPVPIVATTHTREDVTPPLSAFQWLKQANHFTEITNMTAANITEVRVVVPANVGLTVEGTDNTIDTVGGIPTLNEWGIVVLVVLLLLSGYVLKRRQKAGTATT